MTILSGYSSFARILLLSVLCSCFYLAVVVGIFRVTGPLKVARAAGTDLLRTR